MSKKMTDKNGLPSLPGMHLQQPYKIVIVVFITGLITPEKKIHSQANTHMETLKLPIEPNLPYL